MIPYRAECMTDQGATVHQRLKARSRDEALAVLRRRGLYPLSVEEEQREDRGGRRRRGLRLPLLFGRGRALVRFAYKLSTLLRSGIVLLESLRLLKMHSDTRRLRREIEGLEEAVEAGLPLSEGMRAMPRSFSAFFINAVRSGEEGGELVSTLRRVGENMEARQKRVSKLLSAMIYPIFVILTAIGVLTLVQIMVIPRFRALYAGLKFDLPELTEQVMAASDWMAANALWIGLGLGGGLALFLGLRRWAWFRYQSDRGFLMVPLLGSILLKENLSWFLRGVSMLTASGISLPKALELSSGVAKNQAIAREIFGVRESVLSGEVFSRAMLAARYFPEEAVSMAEVGERSGALEEMLGHVATSFEEDLDTTYTRMQTLFEPVMILLLTGLVGLIVIALYLPILTLIDRLGQNF